MRHLIILSVTLSFLFSGVGAVYADTPLFMPHITGGTRSQPEGASSEISVADATNIVCDDNNRQMVVTEEKETSVSVACLPTDEASASDANTDEMLTAARTIRVTDTAIVVCDFKGKRIRVTSKRKRNVEIDCLPASITPESPIATPTVTPTDAPTDVPPTDVPPTATNTPESPTATPTNTQEPPTTVPTNTPEPPAPTATATSAPTNTPEPTATNTPEPPTVTPTATPTNTPAAAPPPANPQPVGMSGEWSLIFSDEFNENSLNLDVWEPSWFGGNGVSEPVNGLEDGCYHPSQVSLSGGTLNLRADTTNDSSCRKKDGSRTPYISGLINTRESFTFAYGYMEARLFLPGENGQIWNWPAWWSDGTGTWPRTGEIDVMEGLESHRACWHYHYEDSSGRHQGPGGCSNMDATGWHTYGALWEPGKITFYYDGQQVGQITEGVIDDEHFLILNYGIREDFGIHAPATMQVDYVRVWKP